MSKSLAKHTAVICFVVLSVLHTGCAASVKGTSETVTKRTANNSFYLEGGGNAIIVSINYDRLFGESFAGRVGLGGFEEAILVPITISYLLGSGAHKLELGTGLLFGSEGYESGVIWTGIVGYRYQPKKRGSIFRVGFTPFFDPEELDELLPWIGISFGVAF
ncbi:hypothetical protein HYR99_36520 [Candidatus Poribacteria bacterium]|nr:hypothetical protein [Candidatus Poribacteria bacterium]